MSDAESGAAAAIGGCLALIVGTIALIVVGFVLLVILIAVIKFVVYAIAILLAVVLGLAAIVGLVALIWWLAEEHPKVLLWLGILAAIAGAGYGLYALLFQLIQSSTLAIIGTVSIPCAILAMALVARAVVRSVKRRRERERGRIIAEREREQAARRNFIRGTDLDRALDDQRGILQELASQLRRAKANLHQIDAEIRRLGHDDPTGTLPRYVQQRESAERLFTLLSVRVARAWGRLVIQRRTNRLTTLLRNMPSLSEIKDASLINDPQRIKEISTRLETELLTPFAQLRDEIHDMSSFGERPPQAEDVYPLAADFVEDAYGRLRTQFEHTLLGIQQQLEELRFIALAADHVQLKREADVADEPTDSLFDVAERMERGLERFQRFVDQTDRQIAEWEVEHDTSPVRNAPPLIAEDFELPDELALTRRGLRVVPKVKN